MLDGPKIIHVVSTKVLLQFFSLFLCLIHIFKKQLGYTRAQFPLITSHVMNVPKGT